MRFSIKLLLAALLVALPAAAWADGYLPAFPGAEGYGSDTAGGRGGKVIEVTNLNDHGPGSLREACDTDGTRTIIFRVSGTIPLESDLVITKPDVTIAGQTAPGDGICLRNYKMGIATQNAIVRYIRVRRGDESNLQDDGIGVYANERTGVWAENVVVDHCSVSWTCDEGINTWHHARNVTIQWCIVSEALHDAIHVGHGFAATIGGEYTTYHHNLLANCPGRNPSIGGNNGPNYKTINLDWRNNVIFNWLDRTLDGKPWTINVINNYWKPGPMTRLRGRIVKMDKILNDPQGHWFVDGNYYDGNDEISNDNHKAISADGGLNVDDWLVKDPFNTAYVNTQSAKDAYDAVLLDGGATLPRRDPVDARIMDEVKTGKTHHNNGIVNSQTDVGAWPELKSADPPVDSDHDGIPDWWEKKYGLDPHDASDGVKDMNGDGYTNLEKYLNGLDPRKKIDWTKPENNKNTLTPASLLPPDKAGSNVP